MQLYELRNYLFHGRTFTLPSYHNFDFADGKIIYTGEYFDATGMTTTVGP